MATDYTTTALIASLKRRGQIPSTAGAMTTADFLGIANEELQSFLMTLMDQVNEEYYVTSLDYAIAAGQDTYAIPPRSVDATLRQVLLVDGNGGLFPLPRVEPETQARYPATGSPAAYKLQGNSVVLVPSPTSAQNTLRLRYVCRPNTLVATSAAAQITAVNTGAITVTALTSTVPAGFGARTLDLVKGTPHFDTLGMDYSCTTYSLSGANSIFTFPALPTGIAVGDWICLPGESPVAQLPWSLHSLLAHRVVATYLEGIGSKDAGMAEAICKRKHDEALRRMKPRVQSGGRALVNRNGPGWTRW